MDLTLLAPILVVNLIILGIVLYLFLHYRSESKHESLVLSRDRRELKSMVASINDGILMLDSQLQLVVANKSLLSILNIQKQLTDDHSGLSFSDVLDSINGAFDLQGAIQKALIGQTIVSLEEVQINTKYVEADVEPVKDEVGNLLGVVIVLRDLTRKKEVERLHEEFTAMMIHELRTPLTTTLYSTSMLLSDLNKLSTEDLAAQIETIKSSSTHLLSLVNDLLDVSKIEAGRFQIVKQKDNLAQLIADKIITFKPLAGQKGILLEESIDPKLTEVVFDQNRIGQVLDNLISNSIKHTQNGKVVIKITVKEPEVLVEIIDTGEGIDRPDLQKLFTKFVQVGKSEAGAVKGTGLGLVIVKGIVEAHGGRVWAASDGLGYGSTFGFSLPLS